MQFQAEAVLTNGAITTFGLDAPDAETAWDLAAEMLPGMPAQDDEGGFKFRVTEIAPLCPAHGVRYCGLCSPGVRADRYAN